MGPAEELKIGAVAERVGLSLRTIRYYEEIGLVEPSGRTEGGFRLYREADVDRLRLVKALKPLGMPLDHLVELLHLCAEPVVSSSARDRRAELLAEATDRIERMERQATAARQLVADLAPLQGGGPS